MNKIEYHAYEIPGWICLAMIAFVVLGAVVAVWFTRQRRGPYPRA